MCMIYERKRDSGRVWNDVCVGYVKGRERGTKLMCVGYLEGKERDRMGGYVKGRERGTECVGVCLGYVKRERERN